MSKFYAVRKGRSHGIFYSWAECEKQVKGFPGAEYKSFKTLAEAEKYMLSGKSSECDSNDQIALVIANIDKDSAIAFVDGSFSNGIYSFGAVIFTKNCEKELSCSYKNEANASSRNVAGEIMGAKAAISYAIAEQKKNITLYYDYKGIELWANKDWKANLPLTHEYVNFIDEAREKIDINFVHVNAHTGIEYNERVDRLAKDALLKELVEE